MHPLTFRIVYFAIVKRFVGIAWNYRHAALLSTRDHATYTEARGELGTLVEARGFRLQWFDGSYTVSGDDELMVPCEALTQEGP